MSGLNPDGLGQSERFKNTEHEAVDTDQARTGESGSWKHISNSATAVSVPGDYSTVQEAISDAPKNLRHEYIIDVSDGYDGSDEDILINGFTQAGMSTGDTGFGSAGENFQLQILGNKDTPSNVTLGTLTVIGCQGTEMPQVWGVTFTGRQSPHADENACVFVTGSDELFLGDVEFQAPSGSNAINGTAAYRSGLHLRRVDFGSSIFTNAVLSKRGACVHELSATGTASDAAYKLQEGGIIMSKKGISGSTVYSGNGYHYVRGEGMEMADGAVLSDGAEYTLGDRSGAQGFFMQDYQFGVERFAMNPDDNGGMRIQNQDLSNLSLGSADDQKIFRHNGNSSITADGASTSQKGYYKWSNVDSEFKFLA